MNINVVISNPPFLGGSRIRTERGDDYFNWLSEKFPKYNKKADYCTYWYYKVLSDCLEGIRVGFLSTNSVTQNNSREASLEKIIEEGGTIFNAYTSFKWSGCAEVYVSIVNFINKSSVYSGLKQLNGEKVDEISTRLTKAHKKHTFLKQENENFDKVYLEVGEIMKKIELYRKEVCQSKKHGLTTLYNQMFDGGHETLRQLHKQLDHAVAYLYGFPIEFLDDDEKIIAFLTHLNHEKTKEN